MNRRGGKTFRIRYTLTRVGLTLSVCREMISKGCVIFVNSRGQGFGFRLIVWGERSGCIVRMSDASGQALEPDWQQLLLTENGRVS